MDRHYCPYCMTPVAGDQPCPSCGLTFGTYTPLPHHLPPGTVLMERYLVGRVLGEGGFGITYIGCDLRLELKVAIKEYFPTNWVSRHAEVSLAVNSYSGSTGSYEKGKNRFIYEARTMAKMDKQPEIVSVRDFFEANGTAYIVMEYVDGTTFKELVAQRGGRIPAGELLHMIEPLFSALEAMHEAGLIHRDISPDNLMLERGTVRLLDFGCARESTQGDETMTITLKHGFAPIEQYQHKGQGPWTDVYGLSATIYYCLTGRTPPQALDRLLDDELILPRSLGVDLTEQQERALLRGMGIKQHQRFRSVREFHAALYEGCGDWAEGQPADQDQPTPPSPPAEEENGSPVIPRTEEGQEMAAPARALPAILRKPWLWAAAAGVVLLILLAVLLPREDSPAADSPEPGASAQTEPSSAPQSLEETDRDEVFAGAVTVSSPEELTAALTDESVPAVICGTDWLGLSGEIEALTKPLLVPEGSGLGLGGGLRLGENGVLWVEGRVNGGVVLTDGGNLLCSETGTVAADLYLTDGEGLVQRGGAVLGRTLTVPSEDAFAGAVTVTTLAELEQALAEEAAAVVIDGAIVLSETVGTNGSMAVLITENGSLSLAEEPAAGWTEAINFAVWESALVNYGTISSGLWSAGEGTVVVNYGTIAPAHGLWAGGGAEGEAPGDLLLNLGQIQLEAYSLARCDITNLDTITLAGEPAFLGLTENRFQNYGAVTVDSGTMILNGEMDNNGDLTVGGRLEIAGTLTNIGSLTVAAEGQVVNQGLVDMYDGGDLTVEEGGSLDSTGGVILTRQPERITGVVDGAVWSVDNFGSTIDSAEATRQTVASQEELLAALADDAVEVIDVAGEVTLTQPVTITRPVYVTGGGALRVQPGAEITVSGSILCVNGALACDALTVENGGMVEVIGIWSSPSGAVSLTLTEGSWLYTRDMVLPVGQVRLTGGSMAVLDRPEALTDVQVDGGSALVLAGEGLTTGDGLTLEVSDGLMVQLCDAQLANFQINVGDNAAYQQNGPLTLDEGTLFIAQEGLYRGSERPVILGGDTLVDNHGTLTLNAFSTIIPSQLGGQFDNYGTLYLATPVTLEGTLNNYGEIRSSYSQEAEVLLTGSGTLTGSTEIQP